jgi:iron complex outermembrane recepter protein
LAGSPYDASQVVALINDRYVNATVQKIDGVDLSIKQTFTLPLGALDAFADVSWLHISQQTLPSTPAQTLTGTLFNPPKTRLRSGLTWTYGGFSSTGIVNYIAGETDTGVTPNAPIGSWTTLDLNLTYRFGRLVQRLPGLETSLSLINAFDRDPPVAKGAAAQFPGVFFDSTNTSAIGRFVAVTFRQRF